MKPRPHWEVRVFSYDVLSAAFCVNGPAVRSIETRMYRWRWLASLKCFVVNTAPTIGFVRLFATMHRAPPKLRSISCPPALPPTARSPGKEHSESVGAGRAPQHSGRA